VNSCRFCRTDYREPQVTYRCFEILGVAIELPPPGGTFHGGLADWWTDNSTKPVHSVAVRPFAIGLREVTRNEYAVFAEATGRTTRSCNSRP